MSWRNAPNWIRWHLLGVEFERVGDRHRVLGHALGVPVRVRILLFDPRDEEADRGDVRFLQVLEEPRVLDRDARRFREDAEHLEIGRLELLAAHLLPDREDRRELLLHHHGADERQPGGVERAHVRLEIGIMFEPGQPDRPRLLAVHRADRLDESAVVIEGNRSHLVFLEALERAGLEAFRVFPPIGEEEARGIHAELAHHAQDQRVQCVVEVERGVELMCQLHQGLQAVDLEPKLLVSDQEVLPISRDLRLQLSVLRREHLRPLHPFEDPPHLDQELLRGERLRQIVVGSVHEPLEPRVHLGARRDHDHRNVSGLLAALDRRANLEPGLLREAKVEDHEVGRFTPDRIESVFPRSSRCSPCSRSA
jgi:hypothetical protein